jgi:hypothetical protein
MLNAKKFPLTALLRMRIEKNVKYNGKIVQVKVVIADKVVDMASTGDKWAINFLFDRIEGKAIQQMNIGGEVPRSLAELIQLGMDGTD